MSSHQHGGERECYFRKRMTARCRLGALASRPAIWAVLEPWVIQDQTTPTELRSAKHYANDCKGTQIMILQCILVSNKFHAITCYIVSGWRATRATDEATSLLPGQLKHQFVATGGSRWLHTNCLVFP